MSKQKTSPENAAGNGRAQQEPDRHAAYLMSIRLENVRCFGPPQTLDLSDGKGKPARWTIILGVNGTGKTTLLQLLVGSEGAPFTDGEAPQIIPYVPRLFSFFQDNPKSYRREGCDRPAEWLIKAGASPSLTSDTDSIAGYPFQIGRLGALSMMPLGDPGPVPWCCAYGASRRLGSASLSKSGPDDSTATLFSDKAELRNPEEWLLRLDYSTAKASSAKHQQQLRLDHAKQLLLSIMPEDEITDIRLTSSTGPNPTPQAEFKTPYGWVPLRQLGYGYQTLITWVADLANRMAERYPDSKNPLAEPAVVLVDEIDLHLHPVWQRKLMSYLTDCFPNTQFIATAHSPLVAQAAADANLAVLRREGDHVVIDNDVDDIRNWRIDQILTSDLFGLETARPPQIEALLVERKQLLAKPKLTATEQRRLKELKAKIGDLPFGETPEERKEREEIRKTLDRLMKERKPAR